MGRDNQEAVLVKNKTRQPILINPYYYVSTDGPNRTARNLANMDKSLLNGIYGLKEAECQSEARSDGNIFYSSPLSKSTQLSSCKELQTSLQLFNHAANLSNIELNSVHLNQLDLILDQTIAGCSTQESLLNNPSKNWVLRKSSGKFYLDENCI